MFRLCALWFANSSNLTVNKLIKVSVCECKLLQEASITVSVVLTIIFVLIFQEGSSLLESRKFLPLMYQLAARMSNRHTFTDFQKILQEVRVYYGMCKTMLQCMYNQMND